MDKVARDSNMELLRIVSMLLIVMHHSVVHGVRLQPCLNADFFWFAGGVGVNCFVLISGYYMITSRVTLAKMVKLWMTVLTYSLGLYLLLNLCILGHDFNPKKFLLACLPMRGGAYWFITAYILLMLVSPFLNHLLRSLSKISLIHFLVVSFVLYALFPGARSNFTWFVFLYSIAAYTRLHGGLFTRSSPIVWLGGAVSIVLLIVAAAIIKWEVICFPACAQLFLGKGSICVLLCSLCLFWGFACLHIGCIRWVNVVASCALGVYLLHDSNYVRPLLWNGLFEVMPLKDSLVLIPYCVGASLLVYVACTGIEFIRISTLGRLYDWSAPRWILPCAYKVWGWMRWPVEKLARYL